MSNSNKVYVNRTLNLKKIKYLGLDMDHTLVRYNSENFERLSHSIIIENEVLTDAEKSFNLTIIMQSADWLLIVKREMF